MSDVPPTQHKCVNLWLDTFTIQPTHNYHTYLSTNRLFLVTTCQHDFDLVEFNDLFSFIS